MPDRSIDEYKEEGNALFKRRKYDQAIEMYEGALEIEPGYLPALYNISLAHIKLGNHEKALEHINRGLDEDPKSKRLMALKEECKEHVEEKEDPNTLKEEGNKQFKLKNYESAISYYDKALDVAPDFVPAMYNKAVALIKMDQESEALMVLRKAQELDPDNVMINEKVAEITGRPKKTWSDLRGPTPPPVEEKVEVVEPVEVVEVVPEPAAEKEPPVKPPAPRKAPEPEKVPDPVKALEPVEAPEPRPEPKPARIPERKPKAAAKAKPPKPTKRKGKPAREKGIKVRSTALGEDITKQLIEDDRAYALKTIGDRLFRERMYMEALSKYDMATLLVPEYSAAWFNKGQTLRALSAFTEARDAFERAHEAHPDHPALLDALKTINFEIDRAQEIEESLKESEEAYEQAMRMAEEMFSKSHGHDGEYDSIMAKIAETEANLDAASKYVRFDKGRKALKTAVKHLAAGDYDKAQGLVDKVYALTEKKVNEAVKEYKVAMAEIESTKQVLKELEMAGIRLHEVVDLVERAEEAVFNREFTRAIRLAKLGYEKGLKEAESTLVIIKSADKDYIKATDRIAEAAKTVADGELYGPMVDPKAMLVQANTAYEEADYISAEVYAKMAIEKALEIITEAKDDYQKVMEDISSVAEIIEEIAGAGADVDKSYGALERAQEAMEMGEYSKAREYAQLAYEAAIKNAESTLDTIKSEGPQYKEAMTLIKQAEKSLRDADKLVDIDDQRDNLKEARKELASENYLGAITAARKVIDATESRTSEAMAKKDSALQRLDSVRQAVKRFKGTGADVKRAEQLLKHAQMNIDNGIFDKAQDLIEEANISAKKEAEAALRKKHSI